MFNAHHMLIRSNFSKSPYNNNNIYREKKKPKFYVYIQMFSMNNRFVHVLSNNVRKRLKHGPMSYFYLKSEVKKKSLFMCVFRRYV